MTTFKLRLLPASYGDAILLSWEHQDEPFNILIDGGPRKIFQRNILPELKKIEAQGEHLNLVINTHIDFDHIQGIDDLAGAIISGQLSSDFVGEWWFNSGVLMDKYFNPANPVEMEIYLEEGRAEDDTEIGVKHGASLEKKLTQIGNWRKSLITNTTVPYEIGGSILTFVSPNLPTLKKLLNKWDSYIADEQNNQIRARDWDYEHSIEALVDVPFQEDSSVFNASSIAFLFEINDKIILFLGDAIPSIYLPAIKEVLEKRGIEKLKVDYVKLSHHGSKFSFHTDLLDLIDCQNFLISTNNSMYGHPSKTTLAKIIKHPNRDEKLNLYFNYDNGELRRIFQIEEGEGIVNDYNFECHFPKLNWNGYELNL